MLFGSSRYTTQYSIGPTRNFIHQNYFVSQADAVIHCDSRRTFEKNKEGIRIKVKTSGINLKIDKVSQKEYTVVNSIAMMVGIE